MNYILYIQIISFDCTSPRDNTQENYSDAATYHPSQKLPKLDEEDMQDTVGEVKSNSVGEVRTIYSCGPLHMDEQRQDDQVEPIYNSSVPIQV